MKKVFFIAALSLVTVFGVSATVVDSSASESYTSSVTVSISGLGEDIDFDTVTLSTIYNLMPQRVKELCVDSYADISSRIERSGKSFTYAGVKITPIKGNGATNLKFSYAGHSVVVENYTKAEFDKIFGL
ncbi:MAG: hypothetical protein J6Q28_03085 [Alistipes sp.]|nr:hypothetical protein [Alistipes sp.]